MPKIRTVNPVLFCYEGLFDTALVVWVSVLTCIRWKNNARFLLDVRGDEELCETNTSKIKNHRWGLNHSHYFYCQQGVYS